MRSHPPGEGQTQERVAVAYLFSRFPHVSQTFTDHEMLGLERLGYRIVVGAIHPPTDSRRHAHLDLLGADLLYGPPRPLVKELEKRARSQGYWPQQMIDRHLVEYGQDFKPDVRAANALYFAQQFRARGISHVHVPFANRATHTMLFLKAITGITFSFTTHGQDFMRDLGSDNLLREMAQEADFIVAVCDHSRRLLQSLCPESADKVFRIYNGLDPDSFPLLPAPPRKPGDPLHILSVGRLIEFKGFHILIKALEEWIRGGGNATLRIVGEGPWLERLQMLTHQLDLAERVRFLGRLDANAVRRELAAADAFALGCVTDEHGVTDLLPTVITEAMLSGLPVISTRLAGVPEMVEDGVTGFLAIPGDIASMAEAMARLSQLPDRGRSLGAAGRLVALEKFTLEKTIPQLSERLAPHCKSSAATVEPSLLAYYDLELPHRLDWLATELPTLREEGARILCALPREKKALETIVTRIPHDIELLPDGMALEMEWTARAHWRRQLEAIRTYELGAGTDGEFFLHLSRRALWFARMMASHSFSHFYTPGSEESLTAWLAARLIPLKRLAATDQNPRFSTSLLTTITSDAVAVSDGSGKLDHCDDILGHGAAKVERIRLGPISLRRKVPTRPEHIRQTDFRHWLGQAISLRS